MPWSWAWQPTPIFLPRESPWAEEFGRLWSVGSQKNWTWLRGQTIVTILQKGVRDVKLIWEGFPGGSDSKTSACNSGDPGLILGSGRHPSSSPGEGNGNPLQYSCLENPMDRGAWRTTVHRVTKIRRDWVTNTFSFTHSIIIGFFHIYALYLYQCQCSLAPLQFLLVEAMFLLSTPWPMCHPASEQRSNGSKSHKRPEICSFCMKPLSLQAWKPS